jgi:hypothetical protein
MLDGVPPHLALPLCAYLDNHSPGRWIGRGGSKRMRSNLFNFWGMYQREYLPMQSKITWWNETTDSRYFAAVVALLRKSIAPFFPCFRIVSNILGFVLKFDTKWSCMMSCPPLHRLKVVPWRHNRIPFSFFSFLLCGYFLPIGYCGESERWGRYTPEVSLWVNVYVSGTRLRFSRGLCQL